MTEKNNNNLMIFNNENFGELKTLTINEEPYFIGKDVAKILGYADVNRAVKQHVDKEDLKVCNRKGYGDLYPTLWNNENDFANKVLINESGVYSLIFGSKLPEAKQFKRWVTSEILPTLRHSRVVILEDATEEAIDYQSKYGLRRIRKTFTESTDERSTYEEYLELSKVEYKAGRVTGEDRIKASKIIIDSLEQKVADNISDMRGSELLAIQELLTDINKDLRILCNRRNGGKLAAKTKELNILNNYLPDINEGYLIEKAPFSENYMYESKMFSKDLVKTSAYKKWISNLHLEQYLPKTLDNVDFTEPLSIWIYYGCMDKFDIANLGKAIIDQIAKYYNFDDKQVVEFHPILNEYVSSYQESYMFVCIKNV